jgi:hypothetical protein
MKTRSRTCTSWEPLWQSTWCSGGQAWARANEEAARRMVEIRVKLCISNSCFLMIYSSNLTVLLYCFHLQSPNRSIWWSPCRPVSRTRWRWFWWRRWGIIFLFCTYVKLHVKFVLKVAHSTVAQTLQLLALINWQIWLVEYKLPWFLHIYSWQYPQLHFAHL